MLSLSTRFPYSIPPVFLLALSIPIYSYKIKSKNQIYHYSCKHPPLQTSTYATLFRMQKYGNPHSKNHVLAIQMKMEPEEVFPLFPSKSSVPLIVKSGKVYLSTAIVHLLSIKSVAASSAAGQANAVTSVLNTVSIAPCFIICNARPTVCSSNINIVHASYDCNYNLI